MSLLSMKELLRSCIICAPSDSDELFQRNFLALREAGLGFEQQEDTLIWDTIDTFFSDHTHVPNITTLRTHFERLKEDTVVQRLEYLVGVKPKTRGDFVRHLEVLIDARKAMQLKQSLKMAAKIIEEGYEIKGKRKEDTKFLKGAVDAVRFLQDASHEIVAPSAAQQLAGGLIGETHKFEARYNTVKNDPTSGIGQFSGIHQMDAALRGVRKSELWIHAAFTGHGKCLSEDTRIWDVRTGEYRTVGEIFRSQKMPLVHALDEGNWCMTTAEVAHCWESGVRQIHKLTSESGREIRVSGNHPFRTPKGWVNAADLQKGDWVAVPGDLSGYEGTSRFTDEEVALVGYLLGDGSIGTGRLLFTNERREVLNHVVHCLRELGYVDSDSIEGRPQQASYLLRDEGCVPYISISRSDGACKYHPWVSPVRVLLDRLGLYGHLSGTKFIPSELWTISDSQVWTLISALWSTDGTIKRKVERENRKSEAEVSYTSKSKELVWGIQALLQRVGVHSVITPHEALYAGELRVYWTLTVRSRDSVLLFAEKADVVGKREDQAEVLEWALREGVSRDWMPPEFLKDLPDRLRCRTRTEKSWYYAKYAKQKEKIQRLFFARFAEQAQAEGLPGSESLGRIAQGNVRWERVKSVEEDGVEMTYDMEVPGYKNFVANGFITHNSSLALQWAYNQAIMYRFSVLYVSLEMPYHQCMNMIWAMHTFHEKFREVRIELGIQRPSKEGPDGTMIHYDRGLEYEKIKNGELNEIEERFLFDHVSKDMGDPGNDYGEIFLEVPDPDKSEFKVTDLKTMAELRYAKEPFEMIIVDHMGLMSPPRHMGSTTENLNAVLRGIKRLCMSFHRGMGIGVLGLFQLSREGFKAAEKNDGRYNLTALSYANEAERSADIVTSGWMDDELKAKGRLYMQCLKSRDATPFERFAIRIEWHCRRMMTDFDGVETADRPVDDEKLNDALGDALDAAFG